MHLTLTPARLGTRGQLYAASTPDGRVIATSRSSFFSAARVLLGQGHPPEEALTASHAGSPIVAMRSTIGEAARWTTFERDRGGLKTCVWQPRPAGGWAGGEEEAQDGP